MNKLVQFIVVGIVSWCVISTNGSPTQATHSASPNGVSTKSVYKRIADCFHSGDSVICLKEYAIEALNDAVHSNKAITVSNYFDIVKNENFKEDNEAVSIDHLPENRTEKNLVLDEMLMDKVDQFVQSRTLKINLAPVAEGRKKKDSKYGSMMLMGGLAMAGMMTQMAMSKIAFMAGSALLIAKVALLLSSLIGLKKLMGGSGGSEHVVVTAAASPQGDHGHGGYGGGGWQRSLNNLDGINSPYRAHNPENVEKNNFVQN